MVEREKDWWLERLGREPDVSLGAGNPPCPHLNFAAQVSVNRIVADGEEPERVTGYLAEVKIQCADCGRNMQFLGLPAGIDTGGAAVSVDGLEARLGLVPQGDALSTLDRIGATFRPERKH